MAEVLRPVAPQERIGALDLLRGWAMFGVLWSNLNDFYAKHEGGSSLDHALGWAQGWLIESRFYTLLILLFGIGFGIQLLRAQDAGTDVRNTYYRRSAALLVIGILHWTLFWFGDILTMYALVAFALVMFRDSSARKVLLVGLVLWLGGKIIVQEAMVYTGLAWMVPWPAREVGIYAHGTWLQILHTRISDYINEIGRLGLSGYVTNLAGFLIGLWSLKSGYLRRVIDDPRATRRLLVVALVAAAVGYARLNLADKLYPFPKPPAQPDLHFFQLIMLRQFVLKLFDWSTEGTALAYACVLLLIWQRPRGARALRPLAATGRMALTTYLTQSIVCTLLFYGFGLGWYGNVGFTGILVITLILFACQMAASTWWLARYRYGPVEWAWRTLTYGRPPAMRIAAAVA